MGGWGAESELDGIMEEWIWVGIEDGAEEDELEKIRHGMVIEITGVEAKLGEGDKVGEVLGGKRKTGRVWPGISWPVWPRGVSGGMAGRGGGADWARGGVWDGEGWCAESELEEFPWHAARRV